MWYAYHQNNSGGGFYLHAGEGIGHVVFVQADSAPEADKRAETIGLYFDGCENGQDCECCGDRWMSAELWYEKGSEIPMYYDTPLPLATHKFMDVVCYLHSLDGTITQHVISR